MSSDRAEALMTPQEERDGDSKTSGASATLIAAASDLLEALKELHLLVDFDEPITDDKPMVFGDTTDINGAMKRARAAIAKAEGREDGAGIIPMTITDNMIERAAKEIWRRTSFPLEHCRKLARAALEAALGGKER